MDTLGKDDLVNSVSESANLSRDTADKALGAALRALRESLIAGKQVVLPEFATLQVARRKAQIVRDPQTGHQYMQPVARHISVIPGAELRKHLDETHPAPILLTVPRGDMLARVLELYFSRIGWEVVVTHSVAACEESLKGPAPRLVVIDYGMPDAQKLVQRVKSERRMSSVPVIILFPEGRDPEQADEFRVCGDEHLARPFEVHALLMLVESELARCAQEPDGAGQQLCIQFPTKEENLDTASQFAGRLFAGSGLIEEKQVAMNAALREAMLNAAQHGNRYNSQKQTKILYFLDREKVKVVVVDEGQGFDHSLYLRRSEAGDAVSAARERYEQGRLGGLGIMLMVRCTDQLGYNQQGNTITLTKYL